VTCFVLAMGNRPQGSNKLYLAQVYIWAIIMVYVWSSSSDSCEPID
jgi:chitin synthase